jgi:hypothetical protein
VPPETAPAGAAATGSASSVRTREGISRGRMVLSVGTLHPELTLNFAVAAPDLWRAPTFR